MLAVLALAGCLRQIPPGPELGDCAEIPEGAYGYGTVGIGTCLAGPADVRFFEQDGGTFLAVTNADPYRSYLTGSLLVIDWTDLAERLAADPPDRMYMDELVAYALPIADDDNGDGDSDTAYLGDFGYLADSRTAIVPGRLTEDAVVRAGIDDAWIVDMSRLEDIGSGMELLGAVQLEDDPQLVEVDPDADRVYVANLTDHSISVLTTAVDVGSELPVEEIDVAPDAFVSEAVFADADVSGSFAEIVAASIEDVVEVFEDHWTLTFVDATVRLYVPTIVSPTVTGLQRYTSGGGPFIESPYGIEVGLGDVNDPSFEIDPEGNPFLYFARDDGSIERAVEDIVAGTWSTIDEGPLLDGALRGAPSVAPLGSEIGLYFDIRPEAGDDAEIGLATSVDNVMFTNQGPILTPPIPGVSYEDAQVAFDPRAGRYRMWLSVREGSSVDGLPVGEGLRWSIGFSESEDGLTWPEPVIVLALDGEPVAAPTVVLLDGRYEMFVAVSDGTTWDTALSTSIDAVHWSDPVTVVEGNLPLTSDPPRVAVHVDVVGAWRIEGADQGPNGSLLPAGTGSAVEIIDDDEYSNRRDMGFLLAVSNGHEVSNDVVPDGRALSGLVPVSAVTIGGRTLVYATAIGASGDRRMTALEMVAGDLGLAVEPDTFEQDLEVPLGREAFSPVVAQDAEGAVMFYAQTGPDGIRIVRAVSTDGLTWAPLDGIDVLGVDETTGWNAVGQIPHAIELTADGVRLWYAGDDGSRFRIGSATAPTLRGDFVDEPGPEDPWRLDAGLPGGFDDSGVKDPVVVAIDGVPHLYYAGFDGSVWRIGHGTFEDDGSIEVRIDAASERPAPVLAEAARTFSAAGVESPALLSQDDLLVTFLYAGADGLALRVGQAIVDPVRPDEMFADQRRPTPDDTLSFETERGGLGAQVIELGQVTDDFFTTGHGVSSITLDTDRGFLYATSKLDDIVYVVDVRDDGSGTFVDENALDLEEIVRIDSGSASAGFRGAALAPDGPLLYVTMREPDGVLVLDTSRLVDDATKTTSDELAVAVLPLPDLDDDAGVPTFASIGGSGLAHAGESLLLVAHFRGNGLSVFDLSLGAWGEEIAWLPNIGETPHLVRVSPDGRWAVVANYLGDVNEEAVSSTLAIVDLDPESERYLEVVTWLANF